MVIGQLRASAFLPVDMSQPTLLISHKVHVARLLPLFSVHRSKKNSWPTCVLPLSAASIQAAPGTGPFAIAISCGFVLRFWCIAFDLEYIFSTKGRVQ